MKSQHFCLVAERAASLAQAVLLVMARGAEPRGSKNSGVSAAKARKGITTMSIQKKSLIGSRPAEAKATAQPVKGTLGEAKAITATSLRRKSARGLSFRAAKKK